MAQTLYVADGLYALALLACPIGMGLMMLLMMRGRHRPAQPRADLSRSAEETQRDAELARLRAEVDQLRAAARHDQDSPNSSDAPR